MLPTTITNIYIVYIDFACIISCIYVLLPVATSIFLYSYMPKYLEMVHFANKECGILMKIIIKYKIRKASYKIRITLPKLQNKNQLYCKSLQQTAIRILYNRYMHYRFNYISLSFL